MDNKITKKRLSNFFSYEWILMLVLTGMLIFVCELLYAFLGVRLTAGQGFKYFYDVDVYGGAKQELVEVLLVNDTFSYDVLSVNTENVDSRNNLLVARLGVQDGDLLITSCAKSDSGYSSINAKIDNISYHIYNFDDLLRDGKNYLKGFLKDEYSSLSEEEKDLLIKDFSNLSIEKIDSNFYSRMKKDNRFRNQKDKEAGIILERARIEDLVKEVSDFEFLMQEGDKYGLFYRYTRYTDAKTLANEDKKQHYQDLINWEVENKRENAPYALKVENLKNGLHHPSQFFMLSENIKEGQSATAKDVAIMAFDFLSYQPDLQFESISFINTIVKSCSDIYNGR